MTEPTLSFERNGRNPRTAITLSAVWVVLVVLYLRFDASIWIVGFFALCTLPTLLDLMRNTRAGLHLDHAGLHWHRGQLRQSVPWDQILHLRLDTRLDLSVRATLVLTEARRIRLPLDATPPADNLAAAFELRGLSVERQHFSLLG